MFCPKDIIVWVSSTNSLTFRNILISFWSTIDMSKNIFGSLGLLWMALPLFFVLYCPMAKYYSYSGPIDDVLLYLLFCILGYSEVQRQRLIFYDLTSVQHGTHHCLYILCYPYSKGELTLYYNLFCSKKALVSANCIHYPWRSHVQFWIAECADDDTWQSNHKYMVTFKKEIAHCACADAAIAQLNKPASTCIIMQSWRK